MKQTPEQRHTLPTKEDTPLPLLSDGSITKLAESYADFEMTKNDGESYSTHLSGYEFAASRTRAFYEPHILSRDAKIKSLEGLVQELTKERDDLIVECHRMAQQITEDVDPITEEEEARRDAEEGYRSAMETAGF